MYRNTVTATTYNDTLKLRVSREITLHRPYILTARGAERILRRDPDLADLADLRVERVEAIRLA